MPSAGRHLCVHEEKAVAGAVVLREHALTPGAVRHHGFRQLLRDVGLDVDAPLGVRGLVVVVLHPQLRTSWHLPVRFIP